MTAIHAFRTCCWHSVLDIAISNGAKTPASGSNVFLHGDILDGQRHLGGLDVYRSKFHEIAPKVGSET